MHASCHKIPVSVLVVVHTPVLDILLLERAAHPGYWQSVTGSREARDRTLLETARREVAEETGLVFPATRFVDWHLTQEYDIFPEWRDRYAPGVTRNTEHVFSLEIPAPAVIRLAPDEHSDHCWLPFREAAARCFSPSNRAIILALPGKIANDTRSL
ncbi:MAG: dihydroneopterin triphosphate diphosphatase [Zoogloeaceae bacterium]|jgi:dATP pyrophosphohydrolase|nr:dihydroneopterin triphosphate diphosphatase [Zoogloeaceae bacterium]